MIFLEQKLVFDVWNAFTDLKSESVSHSVVSDSLTPWTVVCQAPLSWNSPDKNTGVGCHFLLQEIFPTQGSNPGLLHCRQMLYPLSHQGYITLNVLLDCIDSKLNFSLCDSCIFLVCTISRVFPFLSLS